MKNLLYFVLGIIFCLLLNLLFIYPSITKTAYNFGSREGIEEYERHLEAEQGIKEQFLQEDQQTTINS